MTADKPADLRELAIAWLEAAALWRFIIRNGGARFMRRWEKGRRRVV